MKEKDGLPVENLTIRNYDEIIDVWTKSGLKFCSGWRDTKGEIERQLESGFVKILGTKVAGKLVGVILLSDDTRRGWLNRLAVLPEYRRSGIALRLLEEGEKYLKTRKLKIICAQVEKDNFPSQKLMEKAGYKEFVGIKYYSKREGADV